MSTPAPVPPARDEVRPVVPRPRGHADLVLTGWGPRDSRVSMLLQEERAGVTIAVPPEKIREALEQDA